MVTQHQKADQELIKKNNTIINLLVQIIDKIDQLEHRLKVIDKEQENNAKILFNYSHQ